MRFNLRRLRGLIAAAPARKSRFHEPERWMSLSRRLRERQVTDAEFDDVYSLAVRSVSPSFWSPVEVAIRAADLLGGNEASSRVLDLGSGAGKLCIIGAAVTQATFTGIERREHLVDAARAAALRLGVDRASFVHGCLDAIDVAAFDALYFFNPFEENLWIGAEHLDDTVELSSDRFFDDVGRAEKLLADARVGTRVVTYHGFGGEMPRGYQRALREPGGSGFLEMWVKTP